MPKMAWKISFVKGLLLGGAILIAPFNANAEPTPGAASDYSGGNVMNNTAPRFPTPGLSPDTIATANRLSQELASARNAYTTTEQEATRVPRRFARGPGGDCVNPALSRLNEAIRASEEFLSGLSSAQVEQLRRTSNLKIW
uniref:hypothetical protein n=1 Tax=Trichocoleus desertorum TaxID=1481672 RepID=UPI0025B4649E|nr:hypothetical protein [Trichocoleus desertorum]